LQTDGELLSNWTHQWEKGEVLTIAVTLKQSAQSMINSKQCFGCHSAELSETAFIGLEPACGALQLVTGPLQVCKKAVASEDAN
jgi:hypothetical protein